MFQIPAAITAVPTAWKNIEYGREGESLVPLSAEKRDRIRRQTNLDWSKQFVPNVTINDLDKHAIQIAREKYKEKIIKLDSCLRYETKITSIEDSIKRHSKNAEN